MLPTLRQLVHFFKCKLSNVFTVFLHVCVSGNMGNSPSGNKYWLMPCPTNDSSRYIMSEAQDVLTFSVSRQYQRSPRAMTHSKIRPSGTWFIPLCRGGLSPNKLSQLWQIIKCKINSNLPPRQISEITSHLIVNPKKFQTKTFTSRIICFHNST
jgi:hypothetical protein